MSKKERIGIFYILLNRAFKVKPHESLNLKGGYYVNQNENLIKR